MNMATPAVSPSRLNWNLIWREVRKRKKNGSVNKRGYWNSRARSFAGQAAGSGYAVNFLRYFKPDRHWRILDVGCGPGTLAIPLSAHVQAVTAIDISDNMISILNRTCRKQGLGNVDARVLAWEDDWQAAGLRPHDVAIASRSLVVDDLEAAISKLVAMARCKVVISSLVGDGPYDRRIYEAIGRDLDRGPDFLCVYNLLNQMGILADVRFLQSASRHRVYKNIDEALQSFNWMIADATAQEKVRLRDYLQRHLIRHSDGWSLDYCHVARWAVMSWNTV